MPAGASARLRRPLGRLLGAALVLLTLTTPGLLVARSLEMSGAPPGAVPRVLPLVLAHTDFGHLWIARVASVAVLWLVWPKLAERTAADWLSLGAISVVAFTRSASGHAGDHGDFGPAVWVDWLHIAGAGLWGGLIVAFVLAVRPELRRQPTIADAPTIVARFSMLAGIGFAFVLGTGVYNAWRALGSWAPLWNNRYGLVLDAKVGAFVAMALLGAANRFRNVPAVVRDASEPPAGSPAFSALTLASAFEAVIFLSILTATALLLQAEPPSA